LNVTFQLNLKITSLPDVCLNETFSLFWYKEITLEICPDILDSSYIFQSAGS